MEKIDFDAIKGYYMDKLAQHGGKAEGMDWKNKESQYLRFDVISRYIDFTSEPSILDVGCGSAEYLEYCTQAGKRCAYRGIDVVPQMVEISNERFGPDTAAIGDVASLPADTAFDYTIASGTFNARLTHDESKWRSYFFESIENMFRVCRKATIFNCMTEYVDWRYDRLFYIKTNDLTDFVVKRLSRKFIIDHSYPLYEMTITIFK